MKVLIFCLSVQLVCYCAQVLGEPMVAFMCNKPSMFFGDKGWQRVEDVDCLHEPVDILNFCRKVYPGLQVTNVVESGTKVTIGNWCQVDKPHCRHPEHTVTPYKCIVGAFHSEVLLVPEHCVFDHVHDERRCQSNVGWRQVAESACISRGLVIDSSAPLSVCGIDKFQGVEYVCCPLPKVVPDVKKADKTVEKRNEVEEMSDEEDTADYYNRYMRRLPSEPLDEHELFVRARTDMNRQQRDRTNKVIAEWNAAKKHVEDVKKVDPRGAEKLSREVTERFEKTYEALEQENIAEARQLHGIHEERVQATLGKKRQDAVNHFRSLLKNNAQEEELVEALEHYIRVEQKIRLHDVNRYEHLAERDPKEADAVRQQIIDHLHMIDVRIQDTLDLLGKLPQHEKKIRMQMDEFLKTFREIDAGVARLIAAQVEAQLQSNPRAVESARAESHEDVVLAKNTAKEVTESDSDSKSAEKVSKVVSAPVEEAVAGSKGDDYIMPPEPQFESEIENEVKVAHHEVNSLDADQLKLLKKSDSVKHANVGNGLVVGVAVGTVTVFIVLIVGLAIIKRRPYDVTVSHTVDNDSSSPEQTHLSQMQANGYENPTYKYFETRTSGKHA